MGKGLKRAMLVQRVEISHTLALAALANSKNCFDNGCCFVILLLNFFARGTVSFGFNIFFTIVSSPASLVKPKIL